MKVSRCGRTIEVEYSPEDGQPIARMSFDYTAVVRVCEDTKGAVYIHTNWGAAIRVADYKQGKALMARPFWPF